MPNFVCFGLFIFGLALLLGPLVFYWFYDRSLGKAELEDFYDDSARRLGTVLFAVGGISFMIVSVVMFIWRDS